MRRLGRLDGGAYLRAFGLLFRFPQIALGPLLASVAQVLLFKVFPADAGGEFLSSANSSIAGLLAQLIGSFGLAVAIIVADSAWRRGRAPFDDAWEESRRKVGDIVMAALGFGFIIYIASLLGSIVPLVGPLVLGLVAMFFFIYTIPAAAIGGVPGGAALQISLERARRSPLPTLFVTILYVFAFNYVPPLAVQALTPLLLSTSILASDVAFSLIVALIKAIVTAYVALVLAKTYDDVSYGRSW